MWEDIFNDVLAYAQGRSYRAPSLRKCTVRKLVSCKMGRAHGDYKGVLWLLKGNVMDNDKNVDQAIILIEGALNLLKGIKAKVGFYKSPLSLIGINFAEGAVGLENVNYKMPLDEKAWKFWSALGVNVVRVAFKWKWIQPEVGWPLAVGPLADMHKVVEMARANDMHVLWNMHDYGTRDSNELIGSSALGDGAFADVWKRIAAAFIGDPNVMGYGLMNEPSASMPNWPRSVQVCVDAIRSVDNVTPIVVGGVGAGHAWEWKERNGNLSSVVDPSNKIVYEAHQYPDQDSSGVFRRKWEDDIIKESWVQSLPDPMDFHAMLISNFLGWLGERRGIIGETGVPSRARWLGNSWGPDEDYNANWVEALRRMAERAAINGIPVFLWTDGQHFETNKLYVGYQAPQNDMIEMIKNVVATYPRVA